VVRAHASRAEGLRFESDSLPWLNASRLLTQQQMDTRWQHWGDKGSEDRNWPPYLKRWWLRISILLNRHSRTYESIRDYLYFFYARLNPSFSLFGVLIQGAQEKKISASRFFLMQVFYAGFYCRSVSIVNVDHCRDGFKYEASSVAYPTSTKNSSSLFSWYSY